MGDELKNKILERAGIKIENKQHQIVSRTCGRCNYVNKLESKYCERVGCAYPLTQIAFEEIKAAEQVKMQELINKSNLERDDIIQILQQKFSSHEEKLSEIVESLKQKEKRQIRNDERLHILYAMLNKDYPGWNKKYHKLIGLESNKPLSKVIASKLDKFDEQIETLTKVEYN